MQQRSGKNTAQKMKCSIKGFFSKCDQTRKVRIWSHLLKKSLMENFIFCAVKTTCQDCIFWFRCWLCTLSHYTKEEIRCIRNDNFLRILFKKSGWAMTLYQWYYIIDIISYYISIKNQCQHVCLWYNICYKAYKF